MRGVDTTHYHATLDLGKAVDQQGRSARVARRAAQAAGEERSDDAPTIPADVWVDDAGRVRRIARCRSRPRVVRCAGGVGRWRADRSPSAPVIDRVDRALRLRGTGQRAGAAGRPRSRSFRRSATVSAGSAESNADGAQRRVGPSECAPFAPALPSAPMDPVTPSIGWGVLHLYYRVDRERAGARSRSRQARRRRDRVARGRRSSSGVHGDARPQGRPRRDRARSRPRAAPGVPGRAARRAARAGVVVRVAHRAVGVRRDRRRRTRPARVPRRQLAGDELEQRLAVWRDRIAHYREQRIHPKLPAEAGVLLLPDVEAARARRELVRAVVRGSARS